MVARILQQSQFKKSQSNNTLHDARGNKSNQYLFSKAKEKTESNRRFQKKKT